MSHRAKLLAWRGGATSRSRPALVLPKVTVPVLLVVATDGAEDAEAAFPSGPLSVHRMVDADHDVHVQQPRTVADLLHQTFR